MDARLWSSHTPVRRLVHGHHCAGPTNIRPFHVDIPDEKLADLRRRIAATRWPSAETRHRFVSGCAVEDAAEAGHYWEKEHDWRRVEKKLNALPQFSTTIDGSTFTSST